MYKIGILVGSLRKASLTLKMAQYIQGENLPDLDFEIIDLSRLPIYNEDLETEEPPQSWQEFRKHIKNKDAILFITPEYNRSVPAVLKNAIDVGSAPHGHNAFEGKPAGIISLSPGKMGAFGANHHLRQSLVFLDMPVMQQPEAYIGNSETIFDTDNRLVTESTRTFISQFIIAFAGWIKLHSMNVFLLKQ